MKFASILAIGIALGFVLGHLYPQQWVTDSVARKGETTKVIKKEEPGAQVVGSSTETVPDIAEEITVSASALSDSQRAILTKLGIDAERITITPEMIACAYEKLGEARVTEIVDGGAEPSALELLRVAPCL